MPRGLHMLVPSRSWSCCSRGRNISFVSLDGFNVHPTNHMGQKAPFSLLSHVNANDQGTVGF